MVETPVFRCRCGEVLYDQLDAKSHLARMRSDDADHAYTGIRGCEGCGQALGAYAVVHRGGVYCTGECARRETATPGGEPA